MTSTLRYIASIRHPFGAEGFNQAEGICDVCGEQATFQFLDVITDDLAQEWDINDDLKKRYSYRESMHCSACRCSARLRAQAKAISLVFDGDKRPIKKSIDDGLFDNLNVAEINACGDLHQILSGMKNLYYSEYAPKDKKIKHEDLQALSYEDNFFDLVLTSDTLEHVPDYGKAFKEIHRVLKHGGYHIFTVPLIFSRQTRRRIELKQNGDVEQTLPPSYHGSGEPDNLVATEFGSDLLDELRTSGFRTDIYFANPFNKNEVNYVLVSRKV